MASRRACSRQPIFAASSAVVSQSRSLLFVFSDASAFGWDFDAFCGGTTRTLPGCATRRADLKWLRSAAAPSVGAGAFFLAFSLWGSGERIASSVGRADLWRSRNRGGGLLRVRRAALAHRDTRDAEGRR